MPYYLDFDSTKKFRDKLLAKTLDPVYGKSPSPKTFTKQNYIVQNQNEFSNILLPDVDTNRPKDLGDISRSNIFKPKEYSVTETLRDIPRRANLNLYPYFVKSDENLISIMSTDTFDSESELFKFAAKYIRKDPNGPVLARIQQNLYTATVAKVRIADALSGNLTTLQAIIRGRQPLVEGNNSITASSSLVGKGIDFLGTVAGTQLPWSTISGDYLTNPRNPINVRPTNVSNATKIWQDLTGVLGSVIGIDRRPLPTRKPSDLLIENTGNATLARLYDALTYNKYAPNYTTTARSQQSSRLFNFPNQVAQGIKTLIGSEAPRGGAYIGDDRALDVRTATSDIFSGRKVRSSYYLSLMFDPVSAELFHTDRNFMDQGKLDGNLTWISSKTLNKYNRDNIAESISTKYNFREDSILYTTQDMLNSVPDTGGGALSHISHVLDQTSKFFVDGGTMISKGSAVKYTLNGRDVGAEFARVWTKDRPYHLYKDSAPYIDDINSPSYSGGTGNYYRRKNIRRFDGSVLDSTWNLNIAPNSDGGKDFKESTNIFKKGDGFYAKKYMLSIENLAWKNTNLPGFTVNDLPFSERGSNGGRVMWFPPYDVKVNEVSTATWERNNFLGRPEPIYTYQNTERSATLSFKIVVDHPSVLNLLVREHFKTMSDEQADNYINSFFAGVKDVDFYSLVRTYANLDTSDISTIKNYLDSNGDPNQLNRYNVGVSPKTIINPENSDNSDKVNFNVVLNYDNYFPFKENEDFKSGLSYDGIVLQRNVPLILTNLGNAIDSITLQTDSKENKNDRLALFGSTNATNDSKNNILNNVSDLLSNNTTNYNNLRNELTSLKTNLNNDSVKDDILVSIGSTSSSTSDIDGEYNFKLSIRRSYSVLLSIINGIKNNSQSAATILSKYWKMTDASSDPAGLERYGINVTIPLKDLGYNNNNNDIIVRTINYGEKVQNNGVDCSSINFNNTDLKKYSPVMYGCRTSSVKLNYSKNTTSKTTGSATATPTQLLIRNNQGQNIRPPLETMKKIITKTLSEQYYFRVLKEGNPFIYDSLRDKLKYFHPAFHSMTPEGLNSRLTFLQQCLRPGDTIPVKGVADISDIGARNTTFGPPPICVLRIGDFYHSKVVIRDLNISFDDGGWDLNPEGIGVQPMIASVQMQLNFIGGQGLEKPVERLQNALSSNFYGNTEMYDERSISTATSMALTGTTAFSKEFLDSLNNQVVKLAATKNTDGTSKLIDGKYLGTLLTTTQLGTLDYTPLINSIYSDTSNYFTTYEQLCNTIISKYGSYFAYTMLHPSNRKIESYDVTTPGGAVNLNLFSYINKADYNTLIQKDRNSLKSYIEEYDISTILNYAEIITDENLLSTIDQNVNLFLMPNINDKFDEIDRYDFSSIEKIRNSLIKNLDSLNYIIDNGADVKLSGASAYTSTLSSFSGNTLYSAYGDCVTYINNNRDKMYEKLTNTSITADVGKILGNLFYDKVENIMDIIKAYLDLGDEDDTISKIRKNISEILVQSDDAIKFKFGKTPVKKNEKAYSYNISVTNLVNTQTETMKLLFSKKNEPTNKLNYYRNE